MLLGGAGSIALPYVMGSLASAAGFRVALAAVAIPAVAYALLSLLIHARAGQGAVSRLLKK
jgi:branched-subunit amino acid permease